MPALRLDSPLPSEDAGKMKKAVAGPTKPAIHRLYPEVLSGIFRVLADIDPPTKKQTGTRLGWIHVSHVSQSWRGTALGDATLWTTISAEFAAPMVKEMIRRSKNMPINVICEGEETPSLLIVVGLLAPDQLARSKTLRFRPNETLSEALVGRLDRPTPLLEELALGNQRDHCSPLPATLFASTLPRLRRLALQGWMPSSWDAPYLCNLTSLVIHAPHFRESHSLPATKLLEILSRCPKLETIDLRRVVEPLKQGELLSLSSGDRTVALPCLAQVVLEWNLWQVTSVNSLFDCLRIPPACKVHLKFDRCMWSISALHGILAFLAGNTGTLNPLRELSLDASPTGVVLMASDAGNQKRQTLPDGAKYTIEWTAYFFLSRFLLLAICKELRLADVAVLKISADTQLKSLIEDKNVLKRFLSGFPAVKTLVLSEETAVDGVLSVLAEAQGSIGAAGHIQCGAMVAEAQDHTLLLPLLEALVLEAVSLDQYGEGGEMVGDKVGRVLQIRRSLGAKVWCELRALPF